MVMTNKDILILLVSIFCACNLVFSIEVNNDLKDYIVYLGSSTSDEYSTTSQHINILQQVLDVRSAGERLIRSYKRSFSGFAAKLTYKEYEILKSKKDVVSIFPSRTLQVQTTRSWDFLGLPQPSPQQQITESNIIVGVIDTGVWPESASFNDVGLGPIPKNWKGECQGGQNFTCNKKLIGARSYTKTSARDDEGHGSHTASTVAGRVVDNASLYGIANGTARGAVPSARIAAYKVCDSAGCDESGILAAFDDAIADGVDVISISIGGQATQFNQDGVALGAFHAMQNGILTVQSAGNDGDTRGVTGSVAPWLFSVAASTMDRRIVDRVVLGNGNSLFGNSVNTFTLNGTNFPLVYGKDVTSTCGEEEAKMCLETCLDEALVRGKIVVCNDPSPYTVAAQAGALGVIAKSLIPNVSFAYPLPAAPLTESDLKALISYINSAKSPTGNILKSESITDKSAPAIAYFSSRGPNAIASDILKPDITAPGVNILAAYSPIAPVTESPEDTRRASYNLLSGTSMACPHVAGVAAYLKSVHPDWSPAAIKSSLMTTADPLSPSRNPDAEFAYGSGHINPLKAANPGLVYEATQTDYITFLCNSGYSNIIAFTGNTSATCPKKNDGSSPKDVNYPSMSALVNAAKPFTVTFTRTVTNVGVASSTYTSKVTSDSKIQVKVEPSTLSFKSLKETKSFTVTVVGKGLSYDLSPQASASLIWTDGVHSVRSPVIVYVSQVD